MKPERLVGLAGVLGIGLSLEQAERMIAYARLVLEANRRMNLTAITDPQDVLIKHLLDSLTPLLLRDSVLAHTAKARVVDVGPGAGFPAVPLALVKDEHTFVMVEATRRKALFVEQAVSELGLTNVSVEWGRAEEVAQRRSFREQFDVGLARAVAELGVLAEYVLPFVRRGGEFIALKGPQAGEEVQTARNAVATLGGGEPRVIEVLLPGEGGPRALVVIRKESATPREYPRRPGIPAKRPL